MEKYEVLALCGRTISRASAVVTHVVPSAFLGHPGATRFAPCENVGFSVQPQLGIYFSSDGKVRRTLSERLVCALETH